MKKKKILFISDFTIDNLSNLLKNKLLQTEYEFIDTLWPDFTKEIFSSLVADFGARERRFGGVFK